MTELASPRVDRAVLLALAERCQREEPGRKLDAAIAAATGWQHIHTHYGTPVGELPGYPDDWDTIPFFSTSLDAAATLVPPNRFGWTVESKVGGARANATVGRKHFGFAETEAMALCAAALKAKAA
ncbi:hypothetical protein [Reyranella sp.]|uniref:hypothetical protein n=1 Tax=Reyranella sp. TaxID=1929291 RepID=UPI0011FDC696|nr:hypothetical protein [Reyranella sp.]TAJ89703.1 MAG: hypothetical protein EPO50_04890 [Reyranella sp.]